MDDLIWCAAAVAFFVLTAGMLALFERLRRQP